jgi:exonuclease SbcD
LRFLHTADWHLGKTLRHLSRLDEAWAVLQEVLGIAITERVDCVLIAGDVYDSLMPPPEAEEMVYELCRRLVERRIRAVIIGGNHDHPRRLAAAGRILDLVGVHVLGEVDLQREERHVVSVPSRDGEEEATVAMLPWLREGVARRWAHLTGEAPESPVARYAEVLKRAMAWLSGLVRPGKVAVLLAHLMVDGAVVGGAAAGERELHLGQVYAVPPQMLPHGFHYIALGHVHRPQAVKAAPSPARYAGSIMQLDFGEEGQEKQVVLVDIDPRTHTVHATPVRLSGGKRLASLGTPDRPLPMSELEKLAGAPMDADYLRVYVRAEGPTTGLLAQVQKLLPGAVDVIPVQAGSSGGEERVPLRTLQPDELLCLYHRREYGRDPDPEVMALFRRLWDEVAHEAR